MRSVPRIFVPTPLTTGLELALPETAARHVARVLRLGVGSPVTLFDGSGGEYAARLTLVERREVRIEVGAHADREVELPLRVTLAQAVSRGDRMDLTIQKAVELGVSRIVPLRTARSAPLPDGPRLARRLDHWRGVVASACEQSGRNRLPEIGAIQTFTNWLEAGGHGTGLVLDPAEGTPLYAMAPPAGAVTLLVGAEGGLSTSELEATRAAGFRALRLGPRVLRTETAALATLAQIQCLWAREP